MPLLNILAFVELAHMQKILPSLHERLRILRIPQAQPGKIAILKLQIKFWHDV